jgi:hypothetical protein
MSVHLDTVHSNRSWRSLLSDVDCYSRNIELGDILCLAMESESQRMSVHLAAR